MITNGKFLTYSAHVAKHNYNRAKDKRNNRFCISLHKLLTLDSPTLEWLWLLAGSSIRFVEYMGMFLTMSVA